MQTSKELLSQNEIKALLDVLSSPSQENSSAKLSFEWRMAKVANSVKSYLDRLSLVFDEVKVSKATTKREDVYTYKTNYRYLESLHFDNTLALAIIAARFGAVHQVSVDRELSTLEESVLEDVCREIVYIVEKELDTFLIASADLLSMHEVSFYSDDVVLKLGFDFKDQAAHNEIIAPDKTVVEAIVGRSDVAVIEPGAHYAVAGFEKSSVVLMFDKSLCFSALKSSRDSHSLSYILHDALDASFSSSSYYIVVGSAELSDEAYLSLSKGSMLKLSRLAQPEIHKDGRMLSKAKLHIINNKMVVEPI